MTLRPVRNEQRHPVENQLAKTCVVFREVIDLRLGQRLRLAFADGRAIQIGRTIDFEIEIDVIVARIDLFNSGQAQRISRKVAVLVQRDDELIVLFRIGIGHGLHLGNLNVRHAPTPGEMQKLLKTGFFFA